MKAVSVFLRRFLLLVFYANISPTSPFHLEGVKEAKVMAPGAAVAKERWSGPSRGTHHQGLHSEPSSMIFERRHSILSQSGSLAMIDSSSSSRSTSGRENEDYQSDQGKEDEEEEEEDEERQTGRRRLQISSDCQKRLDVDIESCLSGYERTLRNISPKEQLNGPFKLELCHEYEKTMQCLHLSFFLCRPGQIHLQLIAYRLGYLRTFMEQTCDQLDNEDDQTDDEFPEQRKETEKEEENEEDKEEEADDDDGGHSSTPPTTTAIPRLVGLGIAEDLPQQTDGTTARNVLSIATNATTLAIASSETSIVVVVPIEVSESMTVAEPHSGDHPLIPTASADPFASSPAPSAIGATSSSSSSHLRVTTEHVTNGECGDALGCGSRESDEDRDRERTLLRTTSSFSPHPTTSSALLLDAIFPVLNSTLIRSFNGGGLTPDPVGGLTPDPVGGLTPDEEEGEAAVVAIQSSFSASSSSTGEAVSSGAIVPSPSSPSSGAIVPSPSSSVGATKAAQCHPGSTCSRTNSAGNGNRISCSLDCCLVLSAILLLVRRIYDVYF